MKTRDRILQCSLTMFHQFGHIQISAVDIADALDMSPGNLYYHYHGKDSLLAELFYEYEAAINKFLLVYNKAEHEFDDYWSYLNIYVGLLQQYSFFYRDVKLLFSEEKLLKRRFLRLVKGHHSFYLTLLSSMNDNGHIKMSSEQQEVISSVLVLLSTNSLDTQISDNDSAIQQSVQQIIFRTITLIEPYLSPKSRGKFLPIKTLFTQIKH